MAKSAQRIVIQPGKVLSALTSIAILLVLASVIGQVSTHFFGRDTLLGLVPEFSLDREGNVPTFFSATLLLICAALSGIIAHAERRAESRDVRYWVGLTWIFLYLSIDEAAMGHERLIKPLRDILGVGGWLYYAWVIPAIGGLLVFVAVFARFFWRLPRQTRRIMGTASIIYVGGALGMEMVGGHHADVLGTDNIGYALITTVEESAEIAGLLLLLYSLLTHPALRNWVLELGIQDKER